MLKILQMFVEAMCEIRAAREALHKAICDAVATGLPSECVDR